MKTFEEWWNEKACRICCDTHEERARMAWNAALEEAWELFYDEFQKSKHSQPLSNLQQT